MNGLELKWTGEGDGLRLSLSVPGVSALYPVADLIEMLKANPEACAEVMRALAPLTMANANAVHDRAEQAERERDEARAQRNSLGRRVERTLMALNDAGAGYAGQSEPERIRTLRAQLAKTERVVEAAREDAQHCPHACSPPCPFDRAVARTRAALRALDSPVGGSSVDPRPLCIRCAKPWVPLEGCDATVELCPACWYRGERPGVAGTDSEGGAPCTGQVTPGTVSGGASGAATPEGGHAAPTGGPMPPPEPAGSSCCPGCACGVCISRFLEPVPPEVHERGWQWRPVGDGAFAPPFGTVRACVGCGCLVAGGPTACARCAQDSPVGVAATACDHKRQRCENDHAVCRDCGAVNRAVTGVVDWGPPETARDDGSTGAVADDQPASARLEKRADGWHYHDAEYPDEGYVGPFSLAIAAIAHAEGGGYLVDGADEHAPVTRAELVSAVRSAASAVGGPPRRALDALADALEIPHT